MENPKGKQILVVEDDVDLCNSILQTLHQKGYQPIGVTDMRDATLRMKNQKFACLIFDIRLGETESGVELIKLARDRKESLNLPTPIVVISGYLDKSLVQSIAGSIQGALVKPFESDALTDLVYKLIGS